jgi:anti-sigma factor RsiW
MNGHEHLSDDALLDAVYGIAGNEADAHLHGCTDCAQRLHEWHEKRASTVASVEIPGDFLAAQRRKIYERIERPSRKYWLWAPGLAAACALAVGIFVYHPAAQQQPVNKPAEISDAQLFGDIYSMEQAAEPTAAAPARALFEEQ